MLELSPHNQATIIYGTASHAIFLVQRLIKVYSKAHWRSFNEQPNSTKFCLLVSGFLYQKVLGKQTKTLKDKIKYLTWLSCPLETRRWMELEMDLVALDRASESVSSSQASNPCTAASWAIPDPIWPPPTTAMVLISAIHSPLPPWQMLGGMIASRDACMCVCVCHVCGRACVLGQAKKSWDSGLGRVKACWLVDNFDLFLNRKGMSQGLGTWFGLVWFDSVKLGHPALCLSFASTYEL